MQYLDHEKNFYWDSRLQYIMALLCQTIGTTTFMSLPVAAMTHGATGYIIGYLLAYALFGIPLLYMEFIISQFTARDCIQVWRIRPCLSHIGYVHVFWQMMIIVYNHTVVSFIIHYFLISFEDPVPYHVCGKWSTPNCDILKLNYTVNQDCIKFNVDQDYCNYLYKTYPEYQYWRYYVLGTHEGYYRVAWRVCLASALACSVLFLSCFKRKQSLKWYLSFLALFPVAGYIVILIGSIMQRGVVTFYEESIDANFSIFMQKYRISNILQQVLYTLNIGTGVSFNQGAATSFRAPCYSNIVITVAICAIFTVFAVCTITMMHCPFADGCGIKPNAFLNYQMTLNFEKVPILLKQYDNSYFWLILIFSCNTILGLSTNIIILQNLLEMLAERYTIAHKYPGLTCFTCVLLIFFVTIPFHGNNAVNIIFSFRKKVQLVTIFLTILECFVFVTWYGLEKFSEDVHFMQGIKPKMYMKFAWLVSSLVVGYVFFNELLYNIADENETLGDYLGWWTLSALMAFIILITLLKLAVAGFRKQFREAVKVCGVWGPRSDVLLRSRAMFSAQAMTKEYIYRQYHLQAGIMARQQTSNVRRPNNE